MEVREATEEHLDIVNYMMSEFLQETEYGQYYDVDYGRAFLAGLATSEEALLLVLLDNSGVPVGMLGAQSAMSPFVPVRVATELGWWVEPAYRGRSGSLRLLRAYESWARSIGCTHMYMGNLNDPMVDGLYRKLGYVEAEHIWSRPCSPLPQS